MKRHRVLAPPLERVCSGGQTGVDRGALDAAIEAKLEHGGWCPLGRLAEDGHIPARYRLRETQSPEYRVRTEQNVLDSDGTLILYRGRLQGGTRLTRLLAERHGKPLLRVNFARDASPWAVRAWIQQHTIRTLNVAGPRESSFPGIGDDARRFLLAVIRGRGDELGLET